MNCLSVFVVSLFLFVPAVFAEPGDTITTGTVYAYGHELEPPYVLEIVDSTLRVNGVQVYPHIRLEEDTSPPAVEVSEWASKTQSVYQEAFKLQRRLESQKKPIGEITEEMISYIGSHGSLVDSVSRIGSAAFWVYWRDGSREQFMVSRRKRPTMEERLRRKKEHWSNLLESNAIIVITVSVNFICPGNSLEKVRRLNEDIDRARKSTEVELLPENWPGLILSAEIARQFNQPLNVTRK